MIKNLIFDFGKVLVDYDFVPVIHQFFDDLAQEKEFTLMFTDPAFIDRVDREDEPFLEIIHDMQRRHPQFATPLKIAYDRYFDFVTGEVPGMKDTLTELKQQGYRLYGLTNWCSKVHEVMNYYDIFRLLDGRVISSEEHLIKPDLAIYQRLCDKYSLVPQECVFTDDKKVNVDAAIKLRMHGIVFHDAQQFRSELGTLLKK